MSFPFHSVSFHHPPLMRFAVVLVGDGESEVSLSFALGGYKKFIDMNSGVVISSFVLWRRGYEVFQCGFVAFFLLVLFWGSGAIHLF